MSIKIAFLSDFYLTGGTDCCVKLWSAQNACNKDDDDDLMLG